MFIVNNLTLINKKDLRVLVKDFSFTLNQGDKVGLIGEEGNGKSSFLLALYDEKEANEYLEIEGSINIKNEKIGFLRQFLDETRLNMSLSEYLNEAIDYSTLDYNLYYQILDRLEVDEDKINNPDFKIKSLSGGERIKFLLFSILVTEPTILFLDEPSNDLDISSLKMLERVIYSLLIPVMFISHDEDLLSNCTNRIIHFESLQSKSEPRTTLRNISYKEYKKERLSFLERNIQLVNKDKENFDKKMEKYNRVYNSVDYALNTVSRQCPSEAKNLKDKMHSVKSMGRRLEKEKENLTKKFEVEDPIILKFNNKKDLIPPSKTVLDLELENLKINETVLIDKPINLFIKGPEKVVIIGDNGVGKTTLIKLIYEKLKEKDFKIGYMPQNYEDLLLTYKTPLEYLINSYKKEELDKVYTYLGSLKFKKEEMDREISSLSGGEKAKIFYSKMVLDEDEVLILDEPTRNISPFSLDSFIEALNDYKGPIIAISHDRKFIKSLFEKVYLLNKYGLKEIDKEEVE